MSAMADLDIELNQYHVVRVQSHRFEVRKPVTMGGDLVLVCGTMPGASEWADKLNDRFLDAYMAL